MRNKKKEFVVRLVILAIVAMMILGVVVGSFAGAVYASDASGAVEVSSFETSSLYEAIVKANNKSEDFSKITSLTVSGGTLSDDDFHTIRQISSLVSVDLSGCSAVDNKIGAHAFSEFSSLTSFVFPQNISVIENGAFAGCSDIEKLELPNTLTSIGENAFAECISLTDMTIPQNVTEISQGAFMGCGFETLTLPMNLKTIEKNCFNSCGNLKEVTIPANVSEIKSFAFADCASLRKIILEPLTAPSIGSDAFMFDSEIYIMPNSHGYHEGDWAVYYISGEIYGDITVPVVPGQNTQTTAPEDNPVAPDEIWDNENPDVQDTPSTDSAEDTVISDDVSDDDTATEKEETEILKDDDENEDNGDFIFALIVAVVSVLIIGRALMSLFARVDDMNDKDFKE